MDDPGLGRRPTEPTADSVYEAPTSDSGGARAGRVAWHSARGRTTVDDAIRTETVRHVLAPSEGSADRLADRQTPAMTFQAARCQVRKAPAADATARRSAELAGQAPVGDRQADDEFDQLEHRPLRRARD